MKKLLLTFACVLLLTSCLSAQELVHKQLTVSSGGGLATFDQYVNRTVIGQIASGQSSDGEYDNSGGFLGGADEWMTSMYEYLPGDANMYNGIWPPQCIGSDVTYLVGYFRGVSANQPCYLDEFWCSADANGDCNIIGSDVTRLVSYFRGNTTLLFCVDYEPAWLTPDDIPDSAPSGWPNCETPVISRVIPSGALEE